jgi:hypothetical protein
VKATQKQQKKKTVLEKDHREAIKLLRALVKMNGGQRATCRKTKIDRSFLHQAFHGKTVYLSVLKLCLRIRSYNKKNKKPR